MAVVMLNVDLDSPKMVSDQLKSQIEDKVKRGECNPGNRLPTIRQIAIDLELNANTVSRMFRDLENDGYLMYREGAGFYCIDLREKVRERRSGAFDLDEPAQPKQAKPKQVKPKQEKPKTKAKKK